MKTFKLKALEIIENDNSFIVEKTIDLKDGLIINREDKNSTWLIEAYIDESYFEYFQSLKDKNEEIMIQVKITKKTNDPATFITCIHELNKIGKKMNVLFIGTIIDRRKDRINNILKKLINDGYEGKELITVFKKTI